MFNNKFINKFATKNLGLILLGTFISNNFVTLRVIEEDNMNPVLSHGPIYNDIVDVLRASKYHKNDIILYKNPNTGKESFGRLTSFNTDETLGSMSSKIPSGHCWLENDNPRSDEHDSKTFGPVSLYVIDTHIIATPHIYK